MSQEVRPPEDPITSVEAEEHWLCQATGASCRYRTELISLRQQVVRDPLTGLFNVRYLLETLEREIERSHRSGMPTCLMMIDLDHFKQINDRWGHETGNRVLQACSRVILSATRKLDIQCRYGGEEFAVVLPTSDLMSARPVAERIRQLISELTFETDDDSFQVTASVGVAMATSADRLMPSEFIARADKELYRAKQTGRNQVCLPEELAAESRVTADEKAMMHSLFGGDD